MIQQSLTARLARPKAHLLEEGRDEPLMSMPSSLNV